MKVIFFLIILFSVVDTSWALRCQGNLVYEGDTQEQVEQKCGDPQKKETLSTTQPLYNSSGAIYGSAPYLTEVWTYQTSPEDFAYKVYFTNKLVTSIKADSN
ncbi:DUF2845 domain-containing protein [Legionella sp. CNM-1927-20]|uniref:DUF2845 domain-containing protein n=1 Tax=Legionella sp. CNM-1927-20 TaxID=3422221 RepID=UPI00403AD5FA